MDSNRRKAAEADRMYLVRLLSNYGNNEIPGEPTITNEELGELVRYYFVESWHGNWDGFERWHRPGLNALQADLAIYIRCAKEDEDA